MEQEPVSFGQWLAVYRHRLRLSRAELAARTGCAVVTLRKIESEERRPSREMAALLAAELGIPEEQRAVFVRVARGELPLSRLAAPGASERAGPSTGHGGVDGEGVLSISGLPYPTTSFVGREREVSNVQAMLQRPGIRLLTITGPPGVGKTRLALEAAHGLPESFAEQSVFVTLAPILEPGLFLDGVAQAIGLGTSTSQPVAERIGRYLTAHRTLLVLDNFEHLVAAAPKITRLLTEAPNLKVLVTSRVALELSGEHRFVLLPLFAPPSAENVRRSATLAEAQQLYPAIDLFIQRAEAVDPGAQISTPDLKAIGEICRRLDGLPLAIELAAARSSLFTPTEILAQLDDRFALLSAGPRDLPGRQATLWRAIDWSYDLLSPEHRRIFRALSVFAGGCTLQAAAKVCAQAARDNQEAPEVTAAMNALISASLLQRSPGPGGRSRFYMLETVREYAFSQLTASGEAGAVRGRHAGYYLEMAQEAEAAWDRPEEWEWLRQLVAERDNLRAVLRWCIESGDSELALKLNGALFSFWNTCSVLTEARRWLEDSLSLPWPGSDRSSEFRAAAGKASGVAGYISAAASSGDYSQAYAHFERAQDLYGELGDMRGYAWSVRGCAFIHLLRDEHDEAGRLYTESLRICEESGDNWGLAWSQYGVAFVKLARGNAAEAREALEAALAQMRMQRIPMGIFRLLTALGYALLELGDTAGAEALFREGLVLCRETPMLTFITAGIEGLGIVAAREGEAERAALLWGAAEALREVTGERPWHVYRRSYDPALALARAALPGVDWARAWVEGRALTAEQIIAEALREPREPDPSELQTHGSDAPLRTQP